MSICRAFACATEGCQSTIHLHHEVEEKLRRTHETFYCPAGHHNYFAGETDEQREISRLKRSVDRWQDLYDEMLDERDEWKLFAKQCPLDCGYRVVRKSKRENIHLALAFHLVEVHGAEYLARVDESVQA